MARVATDAVEEESTEKDAEDRAHSADQEEKLVSISTIYVQNLDEIVSDPEGDSSDDNKQASHRQHHDHIISPRQDVP